jgi:broad specificity phosphatase PhoE
VKPKRIIILRHGQSTSNANGFAVVDTTPNFKVELTPLGIEQAKTVGHQLQLIINKESIFYYNSPYLRAKQTFFEIKQFFLNNSTTIREDVRIRELDHSFNLNRDELRSELKLKEEFGDFYYRPLRAESLSDLFNRVDSFVSSMFRAFEKSDFPQNVIIVSHSFTIRIFLMRWFHLTIEEFESLQRPKNCGKYIFELNNKGQYVLQSQLLNRKGNNLSHNQLL